MYIQYIVQYCALCAVAEGRDYTIVPKIMLKHHFYYEYTFFVSFEF